MMKYARKELERRRRISEPSVRRCSRPEAWRAPEEMSCT
jgi:hypothetical protein